MKAHTRETQATMTPNKALQYLKEGNQRFQGNLKANRNLLEHLTTHEDCDFEFSVFPKLVALGEVMVFKHTGNWECVDHGRDLVHLNKLWNEGRAFWKVWE